MAKSQQLQIRVSADQKAEIQRRANDAGIDVSKWVLKQVLPPSAERFQKLCVALAEPRAKRSYVLAELNDFLSSLNGRTLAATVGEQPHAALPPFEANYVAAMVAHAATQKSISAPLWIRDIKPLDEPWFASSLKNLRLHLLTGSPAAFRCRNLFIDSSTGDRV